MFHRCLSVLVVASLIVSGGSAWATSVFVDISATTSYTQADPTGVATGGYTVLQGPMPTQATLFYDTFTYPGGTTGTMTNLTTTFTSVNGRIGSTNVNTSGQFVACQTSPAFGAGSTGGWTYANGTATSLPYYYLPGPTQAYETYATAINNNGDTAGYYRAAGGSDPMKPFIRTGGTDYGLTDTTTYGSVPVALNTSGQAVGWIQAGNPPVAQAQVWTYTISGGNLTAQSALNLQTTGNPLHTAYSSVYSSVALGINSSGQVAIAANNAGYGDPIQNAGGSTATFLYNMTSQTCTQMTGLTIFDGQVATGTGTQYGGHAQIINDNGEVVGYTGTYGTTWHAAMWQGGLLTDLNTEYASLLAGTGFVLNNATAIDDNGDIAGYGTYTSGTNTYTNQAFVIYNAVPTPEPGTVTLLAASLVGLLAYAWRKRR